MAQILGASSMLDCIGATFGHCRCPIGIYKVSTEMLAISATDVIHQNTQPEKKKPHDAQTLLGIRKLYRA